MSFSKAKLKRFNDVGVACSSSPATPRTTNEINTANGTPVHTTTTTAQCSSSSSAHPERKEQIEKFFKEAVRFATNTKDFTASKESASKDDKKSKGLRLFRTPSLPQRLRFRHNHDTVSNNNNNAVGGTTSSTPMHSATTTPVKELSKSGSRLKGKEALQHEIRKKNELIESYLSQIDVLKRHVDQLKESEQKLREENSNVTMKTENLIHALQTENAAHKELNDRLSGENSLLSDNCTKLELELKTLMMCHSAEVKSLTTTSEQLKLRNEKLEQELQGLYDKESRLQSQISRLCTEIAEAREQLSEGEEKSQKEFEIIENLRNTNDGLKTDIEALKNQIEQDAFAYAQENKIVQNEMECLKHERNTLKTDLASKCELIRALQEELLDKSCEIDAHCDTIRQLCREKAKLVEKEQLIETAEEKVRNAELHAEQKVQKLESDLENALEREKSYWRGELEKRQKLAENEIIKVELEKQDVMMLLESTNDMLRERDEKIQKYEEQLRNGIDYYIQLTDNLQKQVVDLKQDIAKTITEKYNYQLTLSNTRSTVNILMERLKKSDADVEQYKAELESVQLAKGALEQSYLTLQAELETLRTQHAETDAALKALCQSSQTLQQEVSIKENLFNQILISEEETLGKFNKIASSFQERINTTDVAHYLDMYNELKRKDETRELYMQDMKKALDEFATVLQYAQLELDSKEKTMKKVREECEQLKLENITLKSKVDEGASKKENSTDLEKIEDLLTDEVRAECDKITSWLLSSSTDKSVRQESASEMNDLLKPSTPNSNKKTRNCITPLNTVPTNTSGSTVVTPRTTPKTPRTPRTPRTTPKKTVLFPGKENINSPQKLVLKARNM